MPFDLRVYSHDNAIAVQIRGKTLQTQGCSLTDLPTARGDFFKIHISPGDALNDLGFFSKSPLPTNMDSMSPV